VPGTDQGHNAGVSAQSEERLQLVLSEAREAGYLGPGPLEPQVRHAEGFATVARPLFTESPHLVDMGAGGGLPGLVVAVRWPRLSLTLLDSSERRCAFLRRAVERLDLGSRVFVLEGRAETLGRDLRVRGGFDGAIARSFGRPAVLAECTAPLLKAGGWLVVSEPPAHPGFAHENASGEGGPGLERWPVEPLKQLGLEPRAMVHLEFQYQLLHQVEPCPERFPRRNGVPAKKPLF
jgi:16S rRNA (guanine527-N7)-methyltransferase